MISLALGKKGSGKTALIRKLAFRALQAKRAIYYHDPQHQINSALGKVYTSAAAWAADPRPPFLSIFRECEIEEVAQLALRVRDVTVVLDEMDRAFSQKKWLSPSTQRIVHEGRHYRVSLLGTFRRTANVSEDVLSQTDYAFLFRTSSTSPYDLQTIDRRFGSSIAEQVQSLGMGEFVVWHDDA